MRYGNIFECRIYMNNSVLLKLFIHFLAHNETKNNFFQLKKK